VAEEAEDTRAKHSACIRRASAQRELSPGLSAGAFYLWLNPSARHRDPSPAVFITVVNYQQRVIMKWGAWAVRLPSGFDLELLDFGQHTRPALARTPLVGVFCFD